MFLREGSVCERRGEEAARQSTQERASVHESLRLTAQQEGAERPSGRPYTGPAPWGYFFGSHPCSPVTLGRKIRLSDTGGTRSPCA